MATTCGLHTVCGLQHQRMVVISGDNYNCNTRLAAPNGWKLTCKNKDINGLKRYLGIGIQNRDVGWFGLLGLMVD